VVEMVCLLSLFSANEKLNIDHLKEEYASAKTRLESIARLSYNDFGQKQDGIIDAVIKIRDALLSGVALTPNEKIEIIRLVNQAKIKSAALGTNDGYKTFQIIDSLSEDIRRYL